MSENILKQYKVFQGSVEYKVYWNKIGIKYLVTEKNVFLYTICAPFWSSYYFETLFRLWTAFCVWLPSKIGWIEESAVAISAMVRALIHITCVLSFDSLGQYLSTTLTTLIENHNLGILDQPKNTGK